MGAKRTIVQLILNIANILAKYFLYSSDPDSYSEPTNRLPLSIKPINYNVLIVVIPESNIFHGRCIIEILVLTNTNQIQLHSINHRFDREEYYEKHNSNSMRPLPSATPNSLSNIVAYNLPTELKANVSYILEFHYSSKMNEEIKLFTTSNDFEWIGVTQNSIPFARRVFPCFDEPSFKATFDLSLRFAYEFNATAPTFEKSKMRQTVLYKTTPIMSTYLMTFTISKLYIESIGQVSIVARPQYRSQLEYSRNCSINILAALYDYFGTNVTGITEYVIQLKAASNSELVESLLLYDNNESTLKTKQEVAKMIAYEIVQLWFGFVVTCAWWSDTWMNEGFKTYFQYFGTDLVENSFDLPMQFVVEVIQTVMIEDATMYTSPMSNNQVSSKEDIMLTFDSISLKKGAAFIRMTYHLLGRDKFKESLNEYLTTYAFKSTIPSDLFTIWRKHCPMEFRHFLENYFNYFTTQVGYPVVTFNRISEDTVEVSQKRFLLKDFDTANRSLTYTVPIAYTTSSEKNFQDTKPVFFLQNDKWYIYVIKSVSWIIANIQATGYYRVNYDTKTWNEIAKKLDSDSRTEIHESNRAQIVDDLLSLARAGEIEYSEALTILKYLKNETGYLPWAAALNGFSYIMTRLGSETEHFVPFVVEIIRGHYARLGFRQKNEDTYINIYNRANILAWLCKYDRIGCPVKCNDVFKFRFETNKIPPNIRPVVYCAVARSGNETYFNKLYKKYMAEPVASEKILILHSLGCVKGRKMIEKYFQIIFTDVVNPVDRSIALYNLCTTNHENIALVFDLIDEKINDVANAIGGYSFVASLVFDIAEHFTTNAELQKLKVFIKNHTDKFASSISTLQAAVKNVEFNLEWSTKKLGTIKSFVEQYIQQYPPVGR